MTNKSTGQDKFKELGQGKAKQDKSKKKAKIVKGNVFEVCQDIEAFKTVLDFSKCAESTGADKYMWLIHGSDTYDEDDLKALKEKGLDMDDYHLGAPKNDHVHIYMHFKNPVTLPKIAKAFGVPKQNVQVWTGANAWNNSVSYLTHRTESAQHKYQYDPADVHANFDYVETLNKITKTVEVLGQSLSKNAAEKEFNRLKKLYSSGLISYDEMMHRMSADPGIAYMAAKNLPKLKNLQVILDTEEAHRFFREETQKQRTIWLYGDTGCGKSLAANYMASHFAKKRYPDESPLNNSYQVLASSKGPFDNYSSSVHCIVLDDFRPSASFDWQDTLHMFDPEYYGERVLPARYHNKLQATGVIIVTSRYNPAEFAYAIKKVSSGTTDSNKSGKSDYEVMLETLEEKDSPFQLMRRVEAYEVSNFDGDVVFTHMRPVRYRNGYCEYQNFAPDLTKPDTGLSLEELWEGTNLPYNLFTEPFPYNPYYNRFDLDYHDQMMSEEAEFMLRFRRTYLRIHSDYEGKLDKQQWQRDEAHFKVPDPRKNPILPYDNPSNPIERSVGLDEKTEVEVIEKYDQGAFERVLAKLSEQEYDHKLIDPIVEKVKKELHML